MSNADETIRDGADELQDESRRVVVRADACFAIVLVTACYNLLSLQFDVRIVVFSFSWCYDLLLVLLLTTAC